MVCGQEQDGQASPSFTTYKRVVFWDDAIIKYEGITIKRPTNEIDDVIPEITLNIHDKTEKTATIAIKPDIESAKDALITFVGNYNQAISELNILSQSFHFFFFLFFREESS